MKVLFAMDGSEYTMRAVDFLNQHRDLLKDVERLLCLHVVLPLPPAEERSILEQMRIEHVDRAHGFPVGDAVQSLLESGYPADLIETAGEPADEIIATANTEGIDLIVMGSHGRGALAQVVMGSVATQVLAKSSFPVLILRK